MKALKTLMSYILTTLTSINEIYIHPQRGFCETPPARKGRKAALYGAALALIATLSAPAALAQPPAGAPTDPATSAWFRGLRQPGTGYGCCSEADCRRVEARTDRGRWQFWLRRGEGEGEFRWAPDEAAWVDVPPERVLVGEANPTGGAVACWTPTVGVLCFVPPSMS